MDNPATDMKQLEIHVDIAALQWKEQTVLAYGEKLFGQGDLQMGRQSDRPNAPRTGVQTTQLLEEGNVRISLDTKVLADDMSAVLAHFWDLEYMFSPDQTFFRVTEEDADDAFEVNNGASMLSIEDRDGRYDFRLQFANSQWSKEADKQKTLARYQLDLQNPLIVNNPVALWEVTREAHEALGDPNFADMVARPPQPDLSIDPKEEWTMLLHGEEIHVNPQDNDQIHLLRHHKDYEAGRQDPTTDPEALKALAVHYQEQIQQLQQKKIQQAVVEQAVAAAQQLAGGGQPGGAGGPLTMNNGLFGNPPSEPPGNPSATGPFLYSGHDESLHQA